jgi:nucleoid DNA-binding protein
MNTTSLVNLTAEETGQTKAQTEATLRAALKIVCGVVASGEAVRLHEFGTFETRWRSAREGRNLQTGETISIPAARVVKFLPAKAFRGAVNK